MTQVVSQCSICHHFRRENKMQETCTAFPQKIPEAILLNQADHRQPFPGDRSVRWRLMVDPPIDRHPLDKEVP